MLSVAFLNIELQIFSNSRLAFRFRQNDDFLRMSGSGSGVDVNEIPRHNRPVLLLRDVREMLISLLATSIPSRDLGGGDLSRFLKIVCRFCLSLHMRVKTVRGR